MRRTLRVGLVAAVIGVLVAAPLVSAETIIEGKVRNVDQTGRLVTLVDGTKLIIPDNVQVNRKDLGPGALVKASYQEQERENIVTAIQVQPPEATR